MSAIPVHEGAKMRDSYLSHRVANLRPSGIRKFFDIAATMKDVISLGIGEPDFTTPPTILASREFNPCKKERRITLRMLVSSNCVKTLSDHIDRLYNVEV
jgi:aminotransferase